MTPCLSMPRRRIYEINTRCWLRELTSCHGRKVHLGTIPEEAFARWSRLGFTHIWLMGVWTTGPRARATYLGLPDTAGKLDEVLPDWTEADASGSPYAVAAYTVPDPLGGDAGLEVFRAELHRRGMRLILDFIPNHLGLDHPWVVEQPELFVLSIENAPGAFGQPTMAGPRWLAHGKDPYFPAWIDTVQLDHRRAETRAAVIEELRSVAKRCDGVRCDMAMLLLEEVFKRNWARYPISGARAIGEFWAEAIAAVKRPDFLFVAEAYWDLEERLLQLGFDLAYDKRVTDFVVERRPAALSNHLRNKTQEFLRRSVHFLENHDEARIAGRLSLAEHRAALALVLGIPGTALLHEGQLEGARLQAPVQLTRRPREAAIPEVASLYEELLTEWLRGSIGDGCGQCLEVEAVPGESDTSGNLVVAHWQTGESGFELVVVNLAGHLSRGRVRLPPDQSVGTLWSRTDPIASGWRSEWIQHPDGLGLVLEAPRHGSCVLRFRRVD
jgi:glycosidase